MICINCFHNKTRVINSRKHKKYPQLWRRRFCDNCHGAFTTYEYPSIESTPVVKETTEELGRVSLNTDNFINVKIRNNILNLR